MTITEFLALTPAQRAAHLEAKRAERPAATAEMIDRINAAYAREGIRATVRDMSEADALEAIAFLRA